MSLRRIPVSDLLNVTIRQPLVDRAPPGHCFVSFRTGIMTRQDGKLTVDKRKGQLAIINNEDGMVTLQWFEREVQSEGQFRLAAEPEIDQLIFEFDGHFEWAKKSKRVLSMVFKEEPYRNMFFWLQEPETRWDDSLLPRLNKAIIGNHWEPPPEQAASISVPSATPLPVATPSPLMPPQTHAPPSKNLGAGVNDLLDMNALLASVAGRQQIAPGPGLADILTKDIMTSALQSPGMFEALKEHLPAEHQTQDHMQNLPRAAPFEQQVSGLSMALMTGKIDVGQFGVNPKGPGVVYFLEAIQELVQSEKKNDDEATDMES